MSAAPLNRAQRRAQRSGKGLQITKVPPPTGLYILFNASPHEPGEKAGAHLKTLACFERCRDGTGSTDDADHLAIALSICKMRALAIDDTLADMIGRAQDAMLRLKDRYDRLGRIGFDGPGLTQVGEALYACQLIIDASSPLQMRQARRQAIDAIHGKGAWHRFEREGLC